MLHKRVANCLGDIQDQKLKEHYRELILTLLEKGYFPGLAGVPVVKSGISHIDGEKGVLTFRGYPVQELAEHCSYEDIIFLLLNGDLPTPEEQQDLRLDLLANKEVGRHVAEVIAKIDRELHPMYMLSAGVLLLQGEDPTCFEVDNYQHNYERAVRVIAKLPTIIGIYRTKDPDFSNKGGFKSFAQYCLYCFNQELACFEKYVRIFEKILILHADHTMNNSTFSVRAVGSSKASIYASIGSAINSLSGPLHGGANERVIEMLEEIGSPDQVKDYVEQKLRQKKKVMGIGHRVYKTYDPRGLFLKNNLLPLVFEDEKLLNPNSNLSNLYHIALAMEEVIQQRLSGKRLYPNVDFWSGLVLKSLAIEPEYFTNVFALGRIMGWTAHWVEHMAAQSKIFRPYQVYVGFTDRHLTVEGNK